MATAAERRKAYLKAKEELASRLAAEPDRRKRKQIEQEWKAKQEAAIAVDGPTASGRNDDEDAAGDATSGKYEAETGTPSVSGSHVPSKASDEVAGVQEEETLKGFRFQEKQKSKSQLKKERAEQRRREETARLKEEMKVADQSEPELRRIEAEIAPFKLKIHQIPGDGNCLYRAIEHQLKTTKLEDVPQYSYRELRAVAADRLREHKDELSYFLDEEFQSEDGFERYVNQLKDSDAFGGEVEIRLIAEGLNVPIRIFQKSGYYSYNEGSSKPPLNVSFHRHMFSSNHYNSLIPL